MEIWQSDPPASDSFPGFGRSNTDAQGQYRFITVKPGPVPGRGNAQQAPHIALCILSRGLMRGLVTRAYFHGEKLNETDPLLTVDRGAGAARDADRAAGGCGHVADGRAAAGRRGDGVPGCVTPPPQPSPASRERECCSSSLSREAGEGWGGGA